MDISIINDSSNNPEGERIVMSDSPVRDSVNKEKPFTAALFANLTEKKVATPTAMMMTKIIGRSGSCAHFLRMMLLKILRFRFIITRRVRHSL